MRLQYIDSPGRREIGRKTTLKVTRSTIIKERTFFMDTSDFTGSDLEDKLLQDVCYSCMTDTVYSSGYEDWVAYSGSYTQASQLLLSLHLALTPLTEPRHLRLAQNRRQPLLLRQPSETTPETKEPTP
jgi:hypothetical protein